MKKEKNYFYWTYLFSYLVGALGTTQLIPYLIENGFSEMEKGVILSGIAFVALASQFLFGFLSDKLKKIKAFYLLNLILCTGLNVFLFGNVISDFFLALVLVSLIGGLARCWQGILDTWIFQVNNVKKEYAKGRAIGAVGWALGSWGAAFLLAWCDFLWLAWFICGVGIISAFLALKLPECERNDYIPVHLKDCRLLIQNKPYVYLVLTLLLLFGMGCADIYLVVDKILAIGGTSFHVGLKWGIQSLAEAPVFFFGNRLIARFKKSSLLLFASMMFGVRFLLYGFIQNVNFLCVAALMQMITFPLAMLASKECIEKLCEEKLRSTAQMAAMSVYMGLSLFIMPIACNWLSKITSIDFALLCVAVLSLLAIWSMLLFKKNAPDL